MTNRTITAVTGHQRIEGVLHHVDSTGFQETLATGATQNMNAGSGIQHGGDMAADPDTHVFHEVQVWVTTPTVTKMNPPAINTGRGVRARRTCRR